MKKVKQILLPAKLGVNKWRLALLGLILVYTVFLLFNLSEPAIQWDEINHLNGGLFLLRGEYQNYMNYNSFYPPMFDAAATVFFSVLGVNVFSGRLVAVVFSVLTLWTVFEFTNKMYNPKVAFFAAALLAVMPGYFWLSRLAMIETMLTFFFTASLMLFFMWIKDQRNMWLFLSGLTLGLGFLTKYQTVIAAAIMLFSILLLARDKLKKNLTKFVVVLVTAFIVVVPWIIISYQTYASNMFNEWLYALQMGNPEKMVYSTRFSTPAAYTIFYFIEMVWPYPDIHPVSVLLYAASLAGLIFLAWRRKPEDKYLLAWFIAVFVFFTLIPNKHWRYVMPLFPVLAISTSTLTVSIYQKIHKTLKSNVSVNKKTAVKAVAVLFTVFLASGFLVSVSDAVSGLSVYEVEIPVEQATNYAASHLTGNESLMLVCPFNLFSQDMFRFYLWADGTKRGNQVYQYPQLPVDTYQPDFNVTEFISLCEQYNVKYIVLYDYGANSPFYNSTITISNVTTMLYETHRFGDPTDQPFFGEMPHRLFLVRFLNNQTQTDA